MSDSNTPKKYFHLAYISHPSESFTKKSLVELLVKAQQYNIQREISGILIIRDKSIFQLIEGDEGKVLVGGDVKKYIEELAPFEVKYSQLGSHFQIESDMFSIDMYGQSLSPPMPQIS